MGFHDTEAVVLELLEPMASEALVEAAKKATRDGTHIWVQDALGTYGLVSIADRRAVIVVYPAWTLVGSDQPDFEVDDDWMLL